MADENQTNDTVTTPGLGNGADTGPAIGLISQYVKDLSFENPNSPTCYQWQSAPQVDVQFNISTAVVADDIYESTIKIDISSKHPEGDAFVVDLSYAGLFGIRNVPEDQIQAFMMAEAPRMLFPFARRIIADVTRDGGFMPLMLDPIDFHGLFLQQAQQATDMANAEPAGNA